MIPDGEKLPAVDNQQLRERQMERFVGGVEEIGRYAKETRRLQKINNYFGIGWMVLVFVVIVIGLWAGGGLDGFLDTEAAARSFECVGRVNDSVRTYDDAHLFVTLYGGECVLMKKGVPVSEVQ